MNNQREILVNSEHEYLVRFTQSWRDEMSSQKAKYEKSLFLLPESLKEMLDLSDLLGEKDRIFFLPDAESQKDISVVIEVWNLAGAMGLRRSDAIWGIGGGATTDLAGFVAATWLRGIDWYAIPTSLAGMVDASVGGKTGINCASGKNLIGAFHSPQLVIIDSNFLQSLSDRDFSAGLAEVIKTGFIGDREILNILSQCVGLLQARAVIEELIFRSVSVKAKVVSSDFKEGRLREILNYGHTLAHAIERRENYQMRHGEALSIGLHFIAQLSYMVSGLSKENLELHQSLLQRFGLPISYASGAFAELHTLMLGDKKSRTTGIRFVGLREIENPVWLESVSESEMQLAYERISP
jgi:3-dehydroquinate synthase